MTSTTSPAALDASDRQAERDERLVRVLSRSRGHLQLNLSETWLFTLGGVFVTIGIVLVVVGWVGASRTVLVAGQIPYLISGGLLGLALVFLGGFLYFGYWLAMLVRDGRERAEDEQADRAALRTGIDEVNKSLTEIAALLENAAKPRSRTRQPAS
ncbi:MAG: hypothetical protein JWO37_1584 [Acidimicrobiales bacterium]|jgi:hypothetical protein|nr:hypothetical protein [Acidimicrobiales bacterium]